MEIEKRCEKISFVYGSQPTFKTTTAFAIDPTSLACAL